MNRDHIVRPRWVWAGLALALVGSCVLAAWIATWHRTLGVAGLVLLVVGGATAMRGGILYDTHGARAVTGDVGDVEKNRVHRGTAPGDMITDERLRQEARETSRMTAAILHAADEAPRPAFDKLGAGLLLFAAAFLLPAQAMYPHTHTGQDNALRTLLLGAVVALAALRILLGQRPSRMPSALALLIGIAFIVLAVLTDHDRSSTRILEVTVGVWIVLSALLSFDRAPDLREVRLTPVRSANRPAIPAHARERRETTRGDGAWPENVRIAGVAIALGSGIFWLAHAARRTHLRPRG